MTLFIILKGCCEFYCGRIGKAHQIICTALLYKKFSSMILELLWVERLVASLFVYKAEKMYIKIFIRLFTYWQKWYIITIAAILNLKYLIIYVNSLQNTRKE